MSLKTEGVSCVRCHAYLFPEDDIVYCPVCGAPHHRECYEQLGHCALEEFHGTDRQYDIVKAKEVLNGYQCIAGDMPASILAFEDVQTTQKYCDKLIDLAMDGGMIIRSGCEIPLNAKEENVAAFLNCCK